jgi:SAM-dependent methyltransferase
VIGDLGCGPGLFALAFARACPQGLVYASDIEPAQLDRVRERIHADGVGNVVPVLASPDDPHFPRGRLDVVFVGDTYHHLNDRVTYFERLKNVLGPDGRLALLEYKPGKIPVGPPPDHKLPAGVMQAEIEEAGYVLVEKFDTHLWHDFEVWRVSKPGK